MGKCQVLTCAVALLLSGCVSAPPTTPQVAETATPSLGLGPALAPHFDQAWWRAFHDPQADRLVAQALDRNPSLQSALARIRAAQAELSAARTLDYPQVSLNAQEQRELLTNRYGLLAPLWAAPGAGWAMPRRISAGRWISGAGRRH